MQKKRLQLVENIFPFFDVRPVAHLQEDLLVFPFEPRNLPLRVSAGVRLDIRNRLFQRAFAVEVVEQFLVAHGVEGVEVAVGEK